MDQCRIGGPMDKLNSKARTLRAKKVLSDEANIRKNKKTERPKEEEVPGNENKKTKSN